MEKITAEYMVKKVVGDRGIFGGIELILHFQERDSLSVDIQFKSKSLPKYLTSSIEFGCFNAFEISRKYGIKNGKYAVLISKVKWHQIDSSTSVIAHAANRCVLKALGIEQAELSKQEGSKFTFAMWFPLDDLETKIYE